MPLLASFLCKNYKTLKLASINSFLSIYKNYGQHISIEQLKSIVIVELPVLLSENDLHISYVGVFLIKLFDFKWFYSMRSFFKGCFEIGHTYLQITRTFSGSHKHSDSSSFAGAFTTIARPGVRIFH